MREILFCVIAVLIIIPLSTMAYGESTYDILMPTGSADPNAPFHWSSEKDGDTSGFIEILVNDHIYWKNADTVKHTVTSGTPKDGPSGIFDSGDIEPGKYFEKKFTEVGEFPYYCTLHPWRTGVVKVASGFSVLPSVASDVGDGSKVFNLEYKFNRILNTASVDEETKSITFELKGNTNSEDNTLTILLPSGLISGISSVTIDGVKTEKYTQDLEDEFTTLVINDIPPSAKIITTTGSTIIPEFAGMVLLMLIVSISVVVLFTRKQTFLHISKSMA
ncbi:MAG: PEFG-CTERM sorting domain-containing protein [Nitrosopumilaceae archaeon]